MIKRIFFIFAFASASLFFSFSPVLAQITGDATEGLNQTAKEVAAFEKQTSGTYGSDFLASKIGTVISVVLSFVGVLFFILMIYAGILWMTASGNEQQIAKAKSLLINAIIGIVVVFSAYALTTFLGTELLQ